MKHLTHTESSGDLMEDVGSEHPSKERTAFCPVSIGRVLSSQMGKCSIRKYVLHPISAFNGKQSHWHFIMNASLSVFRLVI